MNERLRQLMLQAGYAAPELAGRAQHLALLVIQDCISTARAGNAQAVVDVIKERFGIE